MATINKKLQLRDDEGNLLFPRTSLDNIQISKNDGRDAAIVYTVNGTIPEELIPESMDNVCMLIAIANSAPVNAVEGDKYYNITQNKIYTYISGNWTDAQIPSSNKLYVNTSNNNVYRYDTTNSTLDDISIHFTVVQSVSSDPSSASTTAIPSELAVATALANKQDSVSGVSPISISNAGSVSLNYNNNSLRVNNGNLDVKQDYIINTVDSLMLRNATAASNDSVYIDGGTIYSLVICPLPPSGGSGKVVLSYNYSTGEYAWVAVSSLS